MNFNTFLDHFDTIAQAPNGIAKLRSLILDLAVRGKLVPQNPEDEPAEKLLKTIYNRHTALGKEFRKPQNLPPIDSIAKPFELPIGWCWCRFTEIGQLERGKSKHRPRNDPSLYQNGSTPLVQTGDVARANGVITTYTALYNDKGLSQSRLWAKGTLCITIAANIGDSAILGFDACFPDSIVGFLPTEPIPDSRYFEFFMRTLKSHLEDFAPSTAQKNINLAILDEVLIPLPPLAEQKRIVEKVDELMALCDRLQTSQETRDNLRQKLRASAIDSLMNAETDKELKKGWAIVRDNWQTLSQKPEDVNDLRRSVLQLAVRGRLVPQNPSDESGSELIKKIKEEQENLKNGKGKKTSKIIHLLSSSEIPYSIPSSWTWIKLGEILLDSFYGPRFSREEYIEDGIPTIRTTDMTDKGEIILRNPPRVKVDEKKLNLYKLEKNDFLITRTGSIGNMAIFKDDYLAIPSAYLIRFRFSKLVCTDYILAFLQSPSGQSMLGLGITKQAQPNINANSISNFSFPLPPLTEQKRIVEKVDELMQMCDRLEESLRQSQQKAEALVASAIEHLQV